MLGRRQLREKTIQAIYSYQQNPIKQDVLARNMFAEIDKIYSLYIYQLNFLIALKKIAEKQMELNKNKYIKTEEDLNPNRKFIRNQAIELLEQNEERLSFSANHQELIWDIHDDLLIKVFNKIKASKLFQDYMKGDEFSFEEDQKFIGKVFLRYVAENEKTSRTIWKI